MPREIKKHDSVAQLVEHIPFKDGVLGSNPSWITRQTMLLKEHFLFYERNKPTGLSSARKIKNEKPRAMRGGIVWLLRSPPKGIMSVRNNPSWTTIILSNTIGNKLNGQIMFIFSRTRMGRNGVPVSNNPCIQGFFLQDPSLQI